MANKEELKDFVITREFNAPQDLVWKAWTEQAHLEKWGSPQGFTMTCKKLHLKLKTNMRLMQIKSILEMRKE